MTYDAREPSRLPLRGTIATVGTVSALTLLLSFQGGPLASTGSVTAADHGALATDELIAADGTTEAATESAAAEAVVERVTYTGDVASIRWGDVQVAVTIEGDDIIDVEALQMPDGDHHTVEYSEYVEPILREEAITTDSAEGLSVLSGATYTSEAYALSLQSALDQAEAEAEPETAPEVKAADAETEPESEPEVVAEDADSATATDEIRTATGDVVGIRWGDVQVAVTVEGDDIIDVEALTMPEGDQRTSDISDRVESILRDEAIASDSADVNVISGATYTSEAYAGSLQSALDQLGI